MNEAFRSLSPLFPHVSSPCCANHLTCCERFPTLPIGSSMNKSPNLKVVSGRITLDGRLSQRPRSFLGIQESSRRAAALDLLQLSSMEHLWQCPKCHRRFANRNQEHSCGQYTVKDFLQGKSRHTIALYFRFEQMVRELG